MCTSSTFVRATTCFTSRTWRTCLDWGFQTPFRISYCTKEKHHWRIHNRCIATKALCCCSAACQTCVPACVLCNRRRAMCAENHSMTTTEHAAATDVIARGRTGRSASGCDSPAAPSASLPRNHRPRARDADATKQSTGCLLYTSPSPRDLSTSRMPSSA